MLFDSYTKILLALASMVYLLSKGFAEELGALADAAALNRMRRGESIENSAQALSSAEQNAQGGLLQAISNAYVSDSAMQSILNTKRTEARRVSAGALVRSRKAFGLYS
jgi:hypothetical protein